MIYSTFFFKFNQLFAIELSDNYISDMYVSIPLAEDNKDLEFSLSCEQFGGD